VVRIDSKGETVGYTDKTVEVGEVAKITLWDINGNKVVKSGKVIEILEE